VWLVPGCGRRSLPLSLSPTPTPIPLPLPLSPSLSLSPSPSLSLPLSLSLSLSLTTVSRQVHALWEDAALDGTLDGTAHQHGAWFPAQVRPPADGPTGARLNRF